MFSLKVSRLARHGKARINGATRRLIHATATQHLQHIHSLTENQQSVKAGVQAVCDNFPQSYWRERDQQSLDPSDFHKALADAGWLGIALPEKHGGAGLGISEACAMMQTITQSGAGMQGAQSIHANVYATQPLSIFGTDKQKREIIPRIVQGEWRTCFGVTEPDVGLDTLSLKTTATKRGDGWVINGQKIWITCAQHAKVMILLARTAAPAAGKSKADGLTLFAIPLDKAREGLTVKRITKMGARGADANEVFFDNYVVPLDTVVGGEAMEGRGFKMILHGMNAERCLIAAEALGLGYAA